MGLHSAGTSQDLPGIPGYLVFRDLWASTVLGLPGMSQDTYYLRIYVLPQFPGCPLILRDVCASAVLGFSGMSLESRDT